MVPPKTKRKTKQRPGGAAAFVVGGDAFAWDPEVGVLTRAPAAEPDAAELERRYAERQAVVAAEHAAQEERRAAEQAAREREEAEALGRAQALLMSVLSKRQRREFRANREFTMVGSDGKRYLIRYGFQHNVFELDDEGNRVTELCGHVAGPLPMEDHMAAQKLALERDAVSYRRVANKWDIRSGGHVSIRD